MARSPELIRLTKADVEEALDRFGAEGSEPLSNDGTVARTLVSNDEGDVFASEVPPIDVPTIHWKELIVPGAAVILAATISLVVMFMRETASFRSSSTSAAVTHVEPSVQLREVTEETIKESPATESSSVRARPSLEARQTRPVNSPKPSRPVAAAARPGRSRPAASNPALPGPSSSTTRANPVGVPETSRRAPAENVATSLAPSSAGVPSATTEPAARPVGLATETLAIERVLSQYRSAYSNLDAGAAREVWPTVNRKALAKAFDRLEAQNFAFASCQIAVGDGRARAECDGTARFVPKVGSKNPRLDQRQWNFSLRKDSNEWVIEAVDVH